MSLRVPASRSIPRLVVVLFAALALPLFAQTKEESRDISFRKGLDARDEALMSGQAAKWEEVVRQMQSAINFDPNESVRRIPRGVESVGVLGKIFGGQGLGTEYLPHFFLGEALSKLDKCTGALDEWANSENQGVIKKSPRLTDLTNGQTECHRKGFLTSADFKQQSALAEKAYKDANTHLSVVERSIRDSGRDVQLGDRAKKARTDVESSYKSLQQANASKNQSDLDAVRDAAKRAETQLVALDAELKKSINTGSNKEPPPLFPAKDKAMELAKKLEGARLVEKSFTKSLTPPEQARRKEADAEISALESDMPKWQAAPNVNALDEPSKRIEAVLVTLRSLSEDIRKRESIQLDSQRQARRKAVEGAIAQMKRSFETFDRRVSLNPGRMSPDMTTQGELLKKKGEQLEPRVSKATGVDELAELSRIQRTAGEITKGIQELSEKFGPWSLRERGVDAALEDGASQFLNGDYERSIATLAGAQDSNQPRLRLQVHLFRAAAQYALYVQSGEMDRALLDRARTEIALCKQIDAAFRPDWRAFGPRFRMLFDGKLDAHPATVP